jgi:hypothetical protein
MTPISVDLTGIKTEFEPLEPGYYDAVVESCELKNSKAHQPILNWRFNIINGEAEGRKAFLTTSLQKQALWKFKQVLVALGYERTDLAGAVEFEPTDVIGMECVVVMVPDEYEGKTRSKLDRVLPAGSLAEGVGEAESPF